MSLKVQGNARIWPDFAARSGAMLMNLPRRLWLAANSIPPIRPRTLLPVLIMLVLWVGLTHLEVEPHRAFVLAVVVAEAYAIWRNLPQAAAMLSNVDQGKPRMLRWPVCVILGLAALQLWMNDPLLTQRVLTGLVVVFLGVMVIGIRRERDMLDRVVPIVSAAGVHVERVSLLRINAIAAAVVIAVNEVLIALETLGVWITMMPVLLIGLHAVYWFMVLMVIPPEDDLA